MRKDLPLPPSKGGKTLSASIGVGADSTVSPSARGGVGGVTSSRGIEGGVVGVLVSSGGEDAPPNDTPASDDIPDPIKPGGGN